MSKSHLSLYLKKKVLFLVVNTSQRNKHKATPLRSTFDKLVWFFKFCFTPFSFLKIAIQQLRRPHLISNVSLAWLKSFFFFPTRWSFRPRWTSALLWLELQELLKASFLWLHKDWTVVLCPSVQSLPSPHTNTRHKHHCLTYTASCVTVHFHQNFIIWLNMSLILPTG